MIIQSIEIDNFRQFKGLQKIEFSTNEDRNITLVQGDNTSGKTTLLQAFLYCLYGKANFKSKDALMNTIVANEMIYSGLPNEVKVSIELKHHGEFYHITRKQRYSVKKNEVRADDSGVLEMSFKQPDGQYRMLKPYEVEGKIEEILPVELSSYFIYDTERFGNITTKSDVTESVKGILGLTVLENTLNHLGKDTQKDTVLGRLNSSLNFKGDKEASDALVKMQKAEEKKEQIIIRQKDQTKQLEHYQNQKIKLEDTLRDLAASAKLQKDRDKKQRELAYEQSFLSDSKESYLKNFQSGTHIYLAIPLMKKALSELKTAQVDDKGIKDMNANSIKDIIERGKCVCGTEIVKGNEAYEYLLDEINFLPPESIGNIIRGFKEKTEIQMNSVKNYYFNLETGYKTILQRKSKVNEMIDEIDAIKEKLKNQPSVANLQQELNDTENKISKIENLLKDLEKQLWELDQAIESSKKVYSNNISTSKKNKEILEYMAYATKIKDWIQNRYDLREGEIKEKLESKVNEYFSQIYHGKRKVKVDDKYRVTLITTSDNQDFITDESQGLETVKNFSFISGLVDLAKEKLNDETNSVEKDAEDYPLILDAPFSNADERHVENISKVLPQVASQLILIVMAKDWNYAEDSMGAKVGKRYFLNKKSEVYTEIEEVK